MFFSIHTALSSIYTVLLVCATVSSEVKIEQLPSPRSLCGEGPHYDYNTQSLYYIDIYGPESTLLRYDLRENKTYAATVDNEPLMTFVLPVDGTDDQFLVGTKNAAKVISWDGKSKKGTFVRNAFAVETRKSQDTNRWNDAKSDPVGRFFGGTQRLKDCESDSSVVNASLYSYDQKNGVRQLKKDIFISNGLTWNTKTNKFYYVDSCTHDVKQFDYDISTGKISKECIIFELRENGTIPSYIIDGMTSDIDGNLFMATYGGHKIIKFNPKSGKILAEYKLPLVSQVTSVAFGGPNLDILFVTTASRGDDQPEEAGHLYKITGSGSIGTPGVKVKV